MVFVDSFVGFGFGSDILAATRCSIFFNNNHKFLSGVCPTMGDILAYLTIGLAVHTEGVIVTQRAFSWSPHFQESDGCALWKLISKVRRSIRVRHGKILQQ